MARKEASYSIASAAPMLDRVWTSMRIMRRFDSGELRATAEAGETAVAKFVKALAAAGYLRLIEPRVSGRPGSRDRWMLLRDTGPLAPIRRRDDSGVYDPNTKRVWNLKGELVADAPPPPPPKLPQCVREALTQLARHGSAKASGETLATLIRHGYITVSLTELGRQAAAAIRPAASQREGRALAAGESS
jgi:hypothetical protein